MKLGKKEKRELREKLIEEEFDDEAIKIILTTIEIQKDFPVSFSNERNVYSIIRKNGELTLLVFSRELIPEILLMIDTSS